MQQFVTYLIAFDHEDLVAFIPAEQTKPGVCYGMVEDFVSFRTKDDAMEYKHLTREELALEAQLAYVNSYHRDYDYNTVVEESARLKARIAEIARQKSGLVFNPAAEAA